MFSCALELSPVVQPSDYTYLYNWMPACCLTCHGVSLSHKDSS